MKILNIHNTKRNIYLFCRDDAGNQVIVQDDSFYPFYYEPDLEGKYVGYDGKRLKKVIVSEPMDVPKYRSPDSYSSDILFTKNYLIHRINKIEKCPIKYVFLDIEVMAKELPTYENPIYPVSCISAWDNVTKETKTWFLKDYRSEEELLMAFARYLQKEKPDLLLAWNVDFDWPYLQFRYSYLLHRDLAKDVSPIHEVRKFHKIEGVNFPAGISILDYLQLFKKVNMREASYALDYIAQKYLKEESWGREDFDKLSETVKAKNINDVKRMVKIEEKFKLITYFNEIRILTKTPWEDLIHNSFVIEMLLFEEAKLKGVVLPTNKREERSKEEDGFEGAIRDCLETGTHYGLGKYDLGSAYPNAVRSFCLDTQNIIPSGGIEVNGLRFKQDRNALLPSLLTKLLSLKDRLKKELSECKPNTEEYTIKQKTYDGCKAVVNSAFGVMGFPSFRIYDKRIASSITYLVRDLLSYVREHIEKEGHKVVFYDTDSIFAKGTDNITNRLNELVKQWAKEKYGVDDITIEFDYEGSFEKVFLVGKCHYHGYLRTKKGELKPETKGMEIKRSSSSKFESEFQKTLVEKILDKSSRDDIIKWIEEEKQRLRTLPLYQISFPCKLTNREYKVMPIFMRAYKNTQQRKPSFKVEKGELFYYTYVQTPGEQNVLAFTEKDLTPLVNERIDYAGLIRRNIDMKVEAVFEAMNWKIPTDQLTLF